VSKNVAVLDGTQIIAINLHNNDYELQQNEILVTDIAFVGGDYIDEYFYPPQPYPSWTRSNGQWQAPTPVPTTEGKFYYWSEDDLSWREITND
jgi:hypothetical protein